MDGLGRYAVLTLFLVALAAGLFLLRRDGGATTVAHDVPNVVQESPNWCWAAVVQQALLYTSDRRPPRQCSIAAAGLGRSAERCCADYAACDEVLTMQGIEALVNKLGGGPAWGEALLDARAVYDQLSRGRIVIAGLWETEVEGHVVIIKGLEWESRFLSPVLGDRAVLEVNDPSGFFGSKVPYSELSKYWRASMIVGR